VGSPSPATKSADKETLMMDLPYGQLAVGQHARSRGRTITETDVVNFCMLTGNWLEIHSNAEFAKQSLYGQRVVQGGLVFVIANALLGFDAAVVAAFYGVDRMRFLKPTFIGDTIHTEAEIIELKDKDGQHGVSTTRLNVVNQRRETVLSCHFSLLIRREPLVPAKNP
jgi:acyl dehydratase